MTGGIAESRAPSYAQFNAKRGPQLVAYYTATQVLDGPEEQRRLHDDRLLMNTARGDIREFARVVSRDYYQFKVADEQPDPDELACWFRRPIRVTAQQHDYLFPWDIGSELRLFDAFSRDFVLRGAVCSMYRARANDEQTATGVIILSAVKPAAAGAGQAIYRRSVGTSGHSTA